MASSGSTDEYNPTDEDEAGSTRESFREKWKKVDAKGAAMLTKTIVSFILLLNTVERGLWTPSFWVLSASVLVFGQLFVLFELFGTKAPIFNLRILVKHNVALSHLVDYGSIFTPENDLAKIRNMGWLTLRYLYLKCAAVLLRAFVRYQMSPHLIPSNTCKRELIQVPSREPKISIDAWIYYPPGVATEEPSPLLINWHGGGFVFSSLGLDYRFCEKLARENGFLVLDADYRKAPENPHPAALEDVEDVLDWIETQPTRFHSERVAVSGFSAGANLALVAASTTRARSKVRAAFAFYPLVDISRDPQLKVVAAPIDPLPVFAQRFFAMCYVPEEERHKDPKVSSLYAEPA
ncbi:hypothetical protein NM208_g15694 [Fusarium decemcellulare]|uniref:Uncharacterized protein n=1 Tax=Fusarium decemcellulare TaxID=57161 RepID=A0ACC1RE44_9HYPO|nr:hypothetical protein NM208_g15694 [Fusarium decemcellulare]